MIPLAEINAAAEKFQVPAETIEKDYIIGWILICLAKSELKNKFVFYGGTAIKRIYFTNHRFSEDIDLLSTAKFTWDYLLQKLSILQYAKEQANLSLTINPDEIITNKNRMQLFVEYASYAEIVGAPKKIRMDFTMNMHSFGEVEDHKILASYSDLSTQQQPLAVMSLNTILANKLGLLIDITRNEPRDLFDVWFLLKRVKQFDFDFEKVCCVFKAKYSFFPTLNVLEPHLKKPSLKTHWNSRLGKQIVELPEIEEVVRDIHVMLKKLFANSSLIKNS